MMTFTAARQTASASTVLSLVIETTENSFGYIATWSQGKELKELRASLETISKTASGLISDIDRHFAEICKERGITPQIQAQTDIPEQAMDEPLPDPTITPQMMEYYGYTDSDMLPLSKDRAMELAEKDITVYMLYADNTEAMVFDTEDVVNHDGLFGISREDWEAIKADIPLRDTAILLVSSNIICI